MLYNVGDFILCRVSNDEKIVFDVDFDDPRYEQVPIKPLEVVGFFKKYYIILAPGCVRASHVIDEEFLLEHQIDAKHLNQTVTLIRELAVGGRKYIDPYQNALSCKVCKEFIPYAQTNQADGSLVCWVCRTTRLH